jgi:hypothetical protein
MIATARLGTVFMKGGFYLHMGTCSGGIAIQIHETSGAVFWRAQLRALTSKG